VETDGDGLTGDVMVLRSDGSTMPPAPFFSEGATARVFWYCAHPGCEFRSPRERDTKRHYVDIHINGGRARPELQKY
jgi:hypothetical protein